MSLTRDQIRSRRIGTISVPVPEWDGDVRLRRLSARKRMQLNHDFAGQELIGQKALEYLARLSVDTAIDDDGAPLFTPEDVEFLIEHDWQVLERIANAALEHNRLNAQILEDAKKNS